MSFCLNILHIFFGATLLCIIFLAELATCQAFGWGVLFQFCHFLNPLVQGVLSAVLRLIDSTFEYQKCRAILQPTLLWIELGLIFASSWYIYFADEFDTISGLGYLGAFGGQKGLEVPQKTTFVYIYIHACKLLGAKASGFLCVRISVWKNVCVYIDNAILVILTVSQATTREQISCWAKHISNCDWLYIVFSTSVIHQPQCIIIFIHYSSSFIIRCRHTLFHLVLISFLLFSLGPHCCVLFFSQN